MNKSELSDKVAATCGLTKAKAKAVVDALFGAPGDEVGLIGDELGAGRKVVIQGFGTFATSIRNARKGVNPATGQPLEIAAKTAVRFKAGKVLKDRLSARR